MDNLTSEMNKVSIKRKRCSMEDVDNLVNSIKKVKIEEPPKKKSKSYDKWALSLGYPTLWEQLGDLSHDYENYERFKI